MTGRGRTLFGNTLCLVTALWYCLLPHLDLCPPSEPLPSKGFSCSCCTACQSSCPCCSRFPAASEAASWCSCDDNSTDSVAAGPAITDDPGRPLLVLVAVNLVGAPSQHSRAGHSPPIDKPPPA